MLNFFSAIFLRRAYCLDKTNHSECGISMYVVHSCSKFTLILFCMTCLNNQSSEAVLHNMLYFRKWGGYVFILQVTSS